MIEPLFRVYNGSTLVETLRAFPGSVVETEGEEHRLSFAPTAETPEMAFGFSMRFPGLVGAHVAMPAAIYAGNRFRSKPYAYSCIVCDPEDFRADLPNTISNVHRLPFIQVLSGDLSMPAIGIGDFPAGQGYWILTDPSGSPLLEVIEDESGLALAVMTPGVREGERYANFGHEWVPSEDRGRIFQPGETASLRIRVCEFPAETPHDLYAKLFDLRHAIWPAGGRHEIPWSAAWDLLEAKFNKYNWDEQYGYYACGDRLSRYSHWQIGWVGGGISSHALLAAGSPSTKEKAMRTMDFMASPGQSPSGFYWSLSVDGVMYSDMIDMDYGHDWHLVRRSGDALYFMVKQIGLAGPSSHWLESVRLCADAFVKLWQREGQFGQFVSQETGEIRVGATTSGAIAPAGLALASQLLNEPLYLRVAEESVRYMVSRFLDLGYTSGGPGEAAQCPDSESAFGLLESLITLYEVTENREWVDLAVRAAHLAASWVMPYDFSFPPSSTFGRLDMRTTGSVCANSQNKSGTPGICTLSGVSLFKLYRATGDRRYLELLAEIAHGITQYLSREDRPVFDMPSGYMCERVNTSDWEAPGSPVGEGFFASCWCETSALLTYAEVPGLYVQPDTGFVTMLDHGDIESVSAEGDVEISNKTKFPMRLTVFSELSTSLGNPLGQDFLRGAPVVEIEPFGRKTLFFDRESGILMGEG